MSLKEFDFRDIAVKVGCCLAVYLLLIVIFGVFSGDFTLKRTEKLFFLVVTVGLNSFLYVYKRRFFFLVIPLCIIASSLIIIYTSTQNVFNRAYIQSYLAFSCIMAVLLLSLLTLINKICSNFFIRLLVALCFILPLGIFWGYYFSSGALINYETVLAIFQTNINESKEYVADNVPIGALAVVGLLVLLSVLVASYSKQLYLANDKKHFTYLLLLVLAVNLFGIYKCRHNLITDIVFDTQKYLVRYEEFNKSKVKRQQLLKEAGAIKTADEKGVYVVVIGESQNKEHMSAYGYGRKTTPWLESMGDNKNFILFEKAFSCHTHTVPTLTYALTAKNQYNRIELQSAASIIEIAEAAGYETAWLSNQVQYSAWDTPITVIASEADQQSWINRNVGESTATNEFDLALLDSLKNLDIKEKMLIVIHLMGNHGSYGSRYPKDFRKFTGRNSVDEYDNSMLYNDYVMKNIYQYAEKIPNFKGLIYFADHSEAVKAGKGHDAVRFVPEMTYIPFYMVLSDDYIAEHDGVLQNLQLHRRKPFTNDLIFNTILGIMDIKAEDVYEQDNDITASKYDADWNRFATLYNKKRLNEVEGVAE